MLLYRRSDCLYHLFAAVAKKIQKTKIKVRLGVDKVTVEKTPSIFLTYFFQYLVCLLAECFSEWTQYRFFALSFFYESVLFFRKRFQKTLLKQKTLLTFFDCVFSDLKTLLRSFNCVFCLQKRFRKKSVSFANATENFQKRFQTFNVNLRLSFSVAF